MYTWTFGQEDSGLFFTITYDGSAWSLQMVEGSMDLNALWLSDGDTSKEGDTTLIKRDSSLNMNGAGSYDAEGNLIIWDDVEVISPSGLGSAGTDKSTYLVAGESFDLSSYVSFDGNIEELIIGIRSTSVNGSGGIKLVASAEEAVVVGTLIDFDNAGVGDPLNGYNQEGYAGFNWSNASVVSVFSNSAYNGTGYQALTTYQDDKVAYTSSANTLSATTQGNDFDFITGVFASGQSWDVNVTIKAYDNNTKVGELRMLVKPSPVIVDFLDQTVVGDAASVTWEGSFRSIDKIELSGVGGSNAPWVGGPTFVGTDDWMIAFESGLG